MDTRETAQSRPWLAVGREIAELLDRVDPDAFASPLRHEHVSSTCLDGGHALFWTVEAEDRGAALALLPPYVARRTAVVKVRSVVVP